LRIGLLNNLRAGRSEKQVTRLLQFLRRHPDIVNVETENAQVVPEALSEMARQEVSLLVVNGGDGTLQHALTEILANQAFDGRVPLIAPLRGGRTNMTALDFGAHRDPVEGMAGIIDAVNSGTLESRVEDRNVLRVEYGPGENVLHGMFYGGGLIAKAINLTHSLFPYGRSQGVFGATVVTSALMARAALSDRQGILAPNKVDIRVDGESLAESEFTLVISSTLNRLFAKMRPFWAEGPGPVKLTCLGSGAKHFGRAMPGILTGRPRPWVDPEHGYTSTRSKRVDMRLDCAFTVDGELIQAEPGRVLSITADDRLRFIRA
jgi:diacylglycerol kinase (ATP)